MIFPVISSCNPVLYCGAYRQSTISSFYLSRRVDSVESTCQQRQKTGQKVIQGRKFLLLGIIMHIMHTNEQNYLYFLNICGLADKNIIFI